MFQTIKEQKWTYYQRVQKNQGIQKERDFLQTPAAGEFLLIYIESQGIQKTLAASKVPI
jgi:hypothetical protein